jgi:hypothetical protein
VRNAAEDAVAGALREEIASGEDGPSVDELLEPVLDRYGWPPVREALFRVLEGDEESLWPVAVAALWDSCGRRDMEADRAIALVYHRLAPDASDDERNLAWSIASTLKGVDYLSDYEPLSDAGVLNELERLRRGGASGSP